jgi:kinetochore protein Nuf2
MSYNPRMSMVPSSQQQNRGKKKEEDSDAFMRLVRLPSILRRQQLIGKARQRDCRMYQ